MVILRTHTSYEGQTSWDQKLARVKDTLSVVLDIVFAIGMVLTCGMAAIILFRLARS